MGHLGLMPPPLLYITNKIDLNSLIEHSLTIILLNRAITCISPIIKNIHVHVYIIVSDPPLNCSWIRPWRVLYPKMHMSCSFLSLVTITAISVRASLVKLPCKGLQTHTIFKNARQESPNTRVLCTRMCEV